jgi:hypothetical protein
MVTADRGVADVLAVAVPDPAELTARILTLYAVKLVNPEIEIGEVVDDGDRVIQVVPPFVEYS